MRNAWLVLLLFGCADPAAPAGAPLLEVEAVALSAGEVLLDARGDARLIARVEAAVPNGDPDRVLTIVGGALDGERVLDARFVGDDVLLLGVDHVLRVRRGEAERELDRAVEAPLSVAGDVVAYVRGEMPFFEAVRAHPGTGEVVRVAPEVTPAWSPALSPDGRELVFVTSATGTPRLYRVGHGFVDTPRVPTQPGGPAWVDDALAFGDEDGVVFVDLSTGQVVRDEPEVSDLVATANGSLLARRGDRYEVIR